MENTKLSETKNEASVMAYKPSKKGLLRGLNEHDRVIKIMVANHQSKLWFKYENNEYSFTPGDVYEWCSKVDSLWIKDQLINPSSIKGKDGISNYNLEDEEFNIILKNLGIL